MNTFWRSVKLIVGLCLVFGQLAYLKDAGAYSYWITVPGDNKIIWPGKQIQYRPAGISFPPGSPQRTALVSVLDRWNESPCDFTYLAPIWDDPSVGVYNKERRMS